MCRRSIVVMWALLACCNIALVVVFFEYHAGEKCFLIVDEQDDWLALVPDDFLSLGVDASEVQNYDRVNWSSPRLRQLTAALAPARIRLGGTMSERLVFSADDAPPGFPCDRCPARWRRSFCVSVERLCKHKFLPFFIMTGTQWTEINRFAAASGNRLLFSFNALLRDDTSRWSDGNAVEILKYSQLRRFDVDWQLGNEPNSYRHVYNVSVSPRTHAQDYQRLRYLLDRNGYEHSVLVGPDTTRPQPKHPDALQYMVEFLNKAADYIGARSWHQYYLNGHTAEMEDFWNPDTFDLLRDQIEAMQNHTREYNHIPMWLSETSSAYGGGAPGLSDTFAASPLWLDKLGLCAQHNVSTVVRQSLIGGDYALIDAELQPSPDWWISAIYKRLVGGKVLRVRCECSRLQRVYAHCTNRNYTNDASAITVYAVNLDMKRIKFLVNGTAIRGANLSIDEFVISAPHNDRRSRTVLLNGWPLRYDPALSALNPLRPHRVRSSHVWMRPYSVAFWVIRGTSLRVCQ